MQLSEALYLSSTRAGTSRPTDSWGRIPDGGRPSGSGPQCGGVAVVGDFNAWDDTAHPGEPRHLRRLGGGTVAEAKVGGLYRFRVALAGAGRPRKSDPTAAV